jgi:hypothetical protein
MDTELDHLADETESAGRHQPARKTSDAERDERIVKEATDFLTHVESVESKQREVEDEDIRFEFGDQWTTDAKTAREGGKDPDGLHAVAPAPALVVNLVEQPIQQIVAEGRRARLSLTVKPKAGRANTKTSDYFKGLIRSIQTDSGATEVRLWALERTAVCGRGNYYIDEDYANDGDFDLDILVKRFLDQGSVYWDPYAQRADKADAEKCLVVEHMSLERREQHPKWKDKPVMPTAGVLDGKSPWFTMGKDGKLKSVLIGKYYRVTTKMRTLIYHPRIGAMMLDTMKATHPEEFAEWTEAKAHQVDWALRDRDVPERVLKLYIIDGTQVLEEVTVSGTYIPVVPTIGKEKFVDGEHRWIGLVYSTKDSCRGFNVSLSSAMERAGSMPMSPYIMAEGQDEDHEDQWEQSAIKRFQYLVYKPTSVDGQLAPPPQRQNLDPQIQSALLLAEAFKNHVGSLTGIVDPAFRAVNPYDRSGKAIEALQRQGSSGTSNYLDNLATISMLQEGRILVDKIPRVYDRPGRVIRVMGEEHDDETAIMLKRPFVRDPDGEPIPVPCELCEGKGAIKRSSGWSLLPISVSAPCPACESTGFATKDNMPETFEVPGFDEPQPVEYVDFGDGQYKVVVSVARSHQSQQEEALSAMMELAGAAPALVPMYADLLVRAMGFSGSSEIADRLRAALPIENDEKLGGAKVPPAMKAKYLQLVQQHQEAMQVLEQAQEALRTDAIKMEGQVQIQQMKAEAQKNVELVKAQREVMALALKGNQSKDLQQMAGALDTLLQQNEHQHDVLIQLLKEKGAKEVERHSVELHDQAADAAARSLETGPKE